VAEIGENVRSSPTCVDVCWRRMRAQELVVVGNSNEASVFCSPSFDSKNTGELLNYHALKDAGPVQ
jgi:hypothetical protein